MAIECGYCEDKVNYVINYCGTSICLDCNDRMTRRGKYSPKEQLTHEERVERLTHMHRETFLDDDEYEKHLEKIKSTKFDK